MGCVDWMLLMVGLKVIEGVVKIIIYYWWGGGIGRTWPGFLGRGALEMGEGLNSLFRKGYNILEDGTSCQKFEKSLGLNVALSDMVQELALAVRL